MNSPSCPPCHGECNQGRTCPAEMHPAYDAWAKWYEELKIDIKANKFMFSRSFYGRAFRAGYDAAMADTKKIVKDGEEWKLWGNDQA